MRKKEARRDDGPLFIYHLMAVLLDGGSNDLSHLGNTLLIGMDAVGLYQFLIICHQRMQINQLKAMLTSHFLLDGNHTIDDDGIVDIPRVLESWDRCAEAQPHVSSSGVWYRWYPT